MHRALLLNLFSNRLLSNSRLENSIFRNVISEKRKRNSYIYVLFIAREFSVKMLVPLKVENPQPFFPPIKMHGYFFIHGGICTAASRSRTSYNWVVFLAAFCCFNVWTSTPVYLLETHTLYLNTRPPHPVAPLSLLHSTVSQRLKSSFYLKSRHIHHQDQLRD